MTMGGGGGDNEVEETPEQRELAKIGVERMKHYDDVIKPVENQFIEHSKNMGEGEADMAAGLASAETAQAFDKTDDKMRSSQMQAGAAPGSGRFEAAAGDVANAEARSGGLSEVDARGGAEDRRLGALGDVVNIGMGEAAEGQQGIETVAGRAAGENIEETVGDYRERVNVGNNVASGVGFGLSQMDDSGGWGWDSPDSSQPATRGMNPNMRGPTRTKRSPNV